MEREFEIRGCIFGLEDDMSLDEFTDTFIAFVESKGWLFGGGLAEIVDGYYVDEEGRKIGYVLDEDR